MAIPPVIQPTGRTSVGILNFPAAYKVDSGNDIGVFVVFVGRTECYWLRYLKSGFRHCFVAVKQGDLWLICDSLKHHMELFAIDSAGEFDLPAFYAGQGCAVLQARVSARVASKHPKIELMTCVTVAKRILGVSARCVWTPWQLFQFLLYDPSQNGSWNQVDSFVGKEVKFQLDNHTEIGLYSYQQQASLFR